MSIEPKLMDPDRLDRFIESVAYNSDEGFDSETDWSSFEKWSLGEASKELVAHAKHMEVEAYEFGERLKSTRSDLAKARATVDEVRHVANLAQEKAARYRDRCPVTSEDVKAAGLTPKSDGRGPASSAAVARTINFQARQDGRPAFDILDEMAAMDPS